MRVRAFVAIELPPAHREAMADHLADCARLAPGYRWVDAGSLHLTLRFAGWLEPAILERVRAGLDAVRGEPFRMALGERGAFGPRGSPRVVWLGIAEGLEACARLAAAAEAACQAAGLEPEPRAFSPHVTLARARRPGERLPELPPLPALGPWTVQDVVLYESRLRQQPQYVPLTRYPLKA